MSSVNTQSSPTTKSTCAAIPWQERPADVTDVFWRYQSNPVLDRNPLPGVQAIFNSAVAPFEDRFVGVFRVEEHSRFSRLRVGWSKDGIDWQIEPESISYSNFAFDPADYAYDPRVVQIEDWYYVTWCAGHNGPTIGVARTKDFREFERFDNAFLPFNRNGVLFPRQIQGKYLMLSRPSDDGHTPFGDIYLSESPDMIHWGKHRVVMRKGGGETGQWWQRTKIGAGPIPIETPEGWLMLYHGVVDTCSGFLYSMGAALLDLDDPSRVLYRTNKHLLTPDADYEIMGMVPNVVFPCAALHEEESGRLAVYYGAADTCTCLAFAKMDEVIEFTKANSTLF